jgi:hypothetical protein
LRGWGVWERRSRNRPYETQTVVQGFPQVYLIGMEFYFLIMKKSYMIGTGLLVYIDDDYEEICIGI